MHWRWLVDCTRRASAVAATNMCHCDVITTAHPQAHVVSRLAVGLPLSALEHDCNNTVCNTCTACTAGKYSQDNLPSGPRGTLFRQLLPEIKPLLEVLGAIAESRGKSMSQVGLPELTANTVMRVVWLGVVFCGVLWCDAHSIDKGVHVERLDISTPVDMDSWHSATQLAQLVCI